MKQVEKFTIVDAFISLVKFDKVSEEEKKKLTKRLNIIEGQLKGIRQMLEDDRYCQDIVIQISAVDKSLKSLGNEILKSHLSSCVVADIKNNNLEVIDEVVSLFDKLN